ncbi:MAG: site-specific integrase [Kiritimatiellia bacterium]
MELNLLRCIFKYGIEVGAAVNNPAKEIKNLKVMRKEVIIPSHDKFLCFVHAARKIRHGKQLVTWIWFRVYTSTRQKESFFVEWKDIDFESNIINIVPKEGNPLKNARRRNIVMMPELRQILLDWRQEWQKTFKAVQNPHDWVFFNPNNKNKQAHGFKRAFAKAREKAGISYFTSKDLRHYSISHGLMSGISKDVLRRRAGHANTQMIEQTYGHLLQEYQAQEMKKFTFFHPNNGSKSGETLKNIPPQEQVGRPEGAPEGKTGDGKGKPNLL